VHLKASKSTIEPNHAISTEKISFLSFEQLQATMDIISSTKSIINKISM
jgi:hypothetical protein